MEPAYSDRKLAEMPRDVLEKAVAILKAEIPASTLALVKSEIRKRPLDWIAPVHFGWGMTVRNLLRNKGLRDDLLPDKNWDDYYAAVIEIAVGERDMPAAPQRQA